MSKCTKCTIDHRVILCNIPVLTYTVSGCIVIGVRGTTKPEDAMQIKLTLIVELTARKQAKRKAAPPTKQKPQFSNLKLVNIITQVRK